MANFLIPAEDFQHHRNCAKRVVSYLRQQRQTYDLRTTKRAMNEIRSFTNLIRTHFNIDEVEDNEEFQQFCSDVRFAVSQNEAETHCDASIAFAASKILGRVLIVTNDNGFTRIKRNRTDLLQNVEIIEPTKLLGEVMFAVEDDQFKEDIKQLIIRYADHFIQYLLNKRRPIDNVVESLLFLGVSSVSSISKQSEMEVETGFSSEPLSESEESALNNYLEGKGLLREQKENLVGLEGLLKVFVEYYKTIDLATHQTSTKFLYVKSSEIFNHIWEIPEKKRKGVLKKPTALEMYFLKRLFGIRLKEALNSFKSCHFREGLFHFSPLIERDWKIDISLEMKTGLKLLYGLFLINVNNFDFFAYLLEREFWKDSPRLQKVFSTLLKIRNDDEIEELQEMEPEFLELFYNLGIYYCNTKNKFGIQVFRALFQLGIDNLINLEWHEDFMKRYLLELRINKIELTESMEDKFLKFLQPNNLEDNTNRPFDKSFYLENWTSVNEVPYFYRQPFYLIQFEKKEETYEVSCWNNTIKSIVLLIVPKNMEYRLENVRSLEIKEGNLKTKNLSFAEKKNARIKIILEKGCEIKFERLTLDIQTPDSND